MWNLLADCVTWQNRMPCPASCSNASTSCETCFGLQGCAWRFRSGAGHEGRCEAWPGPHDNRSSYELAYAECPPVDECELGLATNCKANSTCHDLRHGYTCRCDPGFKGNGEVACTRT